MLGLRASPDAWRAWKISPNRLLRLSYAGGQKYTTASEVRKRRATIFSNIDEGSVGKAERHKGKYVVKTSFFVFRNKSCSIHVFTMRRNLPDTLWTSNTKIKFEPPTVSIQLSDSHIGHRPCTVHKMLANRGAIVYAKPWGTIPFYNDADWGSSWSGTLFNDTTVLFDVSNTFFNNVLCARVNYI